MLVVAYYFPPMGLSGVQRVAKFVKYLPRHGWRPTVLTVDPGGYFAFDSSLLAELRDSGVDVHRTYSLDPTRLFGKKKTVALPSETRRRRLSSVSQFFFVPDNKIGWAWPAIRAGRRLLSSKKFDAVLSSAPPYTGHLIARSLSRHAGLPLVLDFRDDWLGNPRHVYPTKLHRRLHEALEAGVLRSASAIVTINECIADALAGRVSARGGDAPVHVIPQGFDPQDFTVEPERRAPGKMRLLHAGIFYDRQTPDVFLKALAALVARREDVRGHVEAAFVGLVPESSLALADRLGLSGCVRHVGYVPHREVPSYLLSADALWMTIGSAPGSSCISTGKLFEYFGARKPILGLVPPGAAQEALEKYRAAVVAPPDDIEQAGTALEALFDLWRAGSLPAPDEEFVQGFDRERLAGRLAEVLRQVTDTDSARCFVRKES
ncbi:MAG TPA: glycosyltransferase family 4 protein [Rhodothermales bacterium]|nr:glycosyltransferase family 4 protein [Rhodothermales bacterium]